MKVILLGSYVQCNNYKLSIYVAGYVASFNKVLFPYMKDERYPVAIYIVSFN